MTRADCEEWAIAFLRRPSPLKSQARFSALCAVRKESSSGATLSHSSSSTRVRAVRTHLHLRFRMDRLHSSTLKRPVVAAEYTFSSKKIRSFSKEDFTFHATWLHVRTRSACLPFSLDWGPLTLQRRTLQAQRHAAVVVACEFDCDRQYISTNISCQQYAPFEFAEASRADRIETPPRVAPGAAGNTNSANIIRSTESMLC